MTLLNKTLLCPILFGALSLITESCVTKSGFQTKEAQIHIHKELGEQMIPGLAVTIIKEGKVVLSEGYGYASLSDSSIVDPSNTLFRIASISKSMTSALMADLQKEGKLFLDSSIRYHFPSYPEKKYDFTVRQLGGHLAGIRSYEGDEFYSNRTYSNNIQALDIFIDDALLHEPGSKYLYSSYGWNLMSAVCSHAGKGFYLELMKKRVFDQYELTHTFANKKKPINDHQRKYRTGYYKIDNGQIVEEQEVDLSNKWAGGGLESTSEDVAQFAHQFWFSNIISDSIRVDYTKSQRLNSGELTNYGIGWVARKDDQGRNYYGHAGGGVGAKAMMIVYPEDELVIVVLSNCSNAKLADIYFGLADIYTQKSPDKSGL